MSTSAAKLAGGELINRPDTANPKLNRLKAIHVVYAGWCPHCVPVTVEPMKDAAAELGVSCVLHDIDTDDVKVADELVRRYGDWSEDYLIPQVFLEFEGGEMKHVMTGDPRGISFTRKAVKNLLSSEPFGARRAQGPGTQ